MNLLKLTPFVVLAGLPALAATCPDMASLTLPQATVTSATIVNAGAFVQPAAPPPPVDPNAKAKAKGPAQAKGKGGGPQQGKGKGGPAANPYANLPEFCRVMATLKPSSDSDIKVEIWLPTRSWNGKYQAVGNGGWAGVVSYTAMADALSRGYATSSTDTGHVGGRGIFAMDHPEQLTDYAWRSEHEMAVKSKAVIQAFYGSPARKSYWVGCSTGGKQGLTEAQRFPEDFDGIVAGAPANYMIHLHAWSIWVNQATNKNPGRMLSNADYAVLKSAALAACDELDGVKDGLIDNPKKCRFNPEVVQCRDGAATNCLTPLQVAAAKMIYSPARNPRTGEEIFPPLEPGSEMGWGILAGPAPADVAADTFRYIVFKDSNWDAMSFNFDSDMRRADDIDNGLNNAINPDLSPYFRRGGKLLMYHGWNDQLIAPVNSINYYTSVANKLGGVSNIDSSMRLFMAPGMNHCNGGDGPSSFDAVTLLERWAEQGQAPSQMVASHATAGQVDRTRPLCPYPQTAVYKGSGSIDDAASFSCKAP